MIKLTFLVENKTENSLCMAEHGLSILIETGEKTILFDTGSSDLFADNAAKIGADLSKVDAVVISHGHYDHTGGVPAFCRANAKAKIFVHKDAFEEFYGMENGEMDTEPCGILWSKEEYDAIRERLFLTDGVHKITDDLIISGTIPKVPGAVMPEKFFIKDDNGEYTPDEMKHEQFFVVRNKDKGGRNEGLFVFSGCSHQGVIPVLRYVENLFPGEKIRCLVAGMHLYNATGEVRKIVVDEVSKLGIETVMPVHCTGINAICDLKSAMGENCIVASAGKVFEF
ncbi:MAG: MBL fold metallo-hydrolase [Clostridia bacterium]|nr:MBL fold metallo-hydrolase [Clostridia bacterium]